MESEQKILVVSPHPDDETLGCGGTLLRHMREGDKTYWLNVTDINVETGWAEEKVMVRRNELEKVNAAYTFVDSINLSLPPAELDTFPFRQIVEKVGNVVQSIGATTIYTPYAHDVHTDHQIVARAINACIKWYRYPSVKRVLSYETLSETDFKVNWDVVFRPNTYVDISATLEDKLKIMEMYDSEIEPFPFPRSTKAIRALAYLRGSQSGFEAAEGFQLVLDRI